MFLCVKPHCYGVQGVIQYEQTLDSALQARTLRGGKFAVSIKST